MNPFLDNFINSLNAVETKRVTTVLEQAKVNTNKYDDLAEQISRTILNVDFFVNFQQPRGLMKGNDFLSNFDSIDERMEQLFTSSNTSSLLINSYSHSLVSDIKSVESELNDLEKAIGNYAFLLSDAKAFDYAFLEPFSDTVNQELVDKFNEDRDKTFFRDDETASVDSEEGFLAISQGLTTSYSVSPIMIKNNYASYERSNTGLTGSTTENEQDGWRVSIGSPTPIKSPLPEFENLYATPPSGYVGALAVIDFVLDSAAICDTIKVTPFSEHPVEITQVVMYHGTEGQEEKHLLDEPIVIDSAINLFFPITSISKFRIFLRQPLYVRMLPNVNRDAQEYNKDFIAPYIRVNQDKYKEVADSMGVFLDKLLGIQSRYPETGSPTSPLPSSRDTIPDLESFEAYVINLINQNPFLVESDDDGAPTKAEVSQKDKLISRVIAIVRNKMLKQGYYNLGNDNQEITANSNGTDSDSQADPEVAEPPLYVYSMGLQNVVVGTGSQGFKAVYVSKILESHSDLTDIKIRVSDFNFKTTNRVNDSIPVTSVEYSVTNNSNPQNEYNVFKNPGGQWYPILPSETYVVQGERLLLDSQGKAYLRFPASFAAPLTVYKNGEQLALQTADMMIEPSRQVIYGVSLPSLQYSPVDILTCNYTPAEDQTVINFDSLGAPTPAVSPFISNDGVGESFTNSFGQLSLNLSKVPWVDMTKLDPGLDEKFGITGYQPITVRFSDGSIAFNFTNYIDGDHLPLDSNSDDHQFVQNGTILLFNKPITNSARIYYHYTPCNVRLRVILRCNYQTFISPKVDFVQLKAKTRKPV